MGKSLAGVLIGLLLASLPAAAQQANFPGFLARSATPGTAPARAQRARLPHVSAPKARAAAKPTSAKLATVNPAEPAAAEPTASLPKNKKNAAQNPKTTAQNAKTTQANGGIPEAERLAIQADLAWLGDYDGAAGGDFDEHVVTAIKAFQKRRNERETGVLSAEARAALANGRRRHEEAVGWQVIDDAATGARFGLATKIVPRAATLRNGSRWTSGQGQAVQVETVRLHEASLSALYEEERRTPRTRRTEYGALKPNSFALSGTQGLKRFYERVQASGTELRGITILFDQATEGTVAPVAIAMANSFEGFPDPNAVPPPGRKRGVEYATAIVVGSDGRLIAPAQATEDCQSITIPGFGHAERVAADRNADLALLRLYGARNLAPLALAAGVRSASDLTLAGVAEPLAQGGGNAVTQVPARLVDLAHDLALEPAPKPGFAGAAALDSQGRLAGMVELKAPLVAGNGAVSAQATLVAVDTIRAFLNAHGIAPATGNGPTDQSVVRLICVRK